MFYVNLLFGIFIGLFFMFFCISSLFEKEYRAAIISFVFFLLNSIFWVLIIHFIEYDLVKYFNFFVIGIIIIFILISFVKYFPKKGKEDLSKVERFDERNHMFSRNNLQFYPEFKKIYYKENPDKKDIDKTIHGLPELGEKGASFYNLYYSNIANASFKVLDRTTFLVNGENNNEKIEVDKNEITNAIKFMAKYYGAVDVGITKLRDYHLYSYHGRRAENWGEKIEKKHEYAIVILVKMNYDMIKEAPSLPIILESSKHYVEAAKIAHLIAEYIRGFGYEARSHVDGNYEVLAVPLAKDAGLGEVGRMGLLIHPEYGPAIRISIVTTNLELIETKKKKDYHIDEFCRICKKCADNCPTKSISFDDEKPYSRNFKHWSIVQEKCYAFWKKIGTDCAFCIRSCPYNKKDTLLHRLVRFYISLNPINQRVALFFDDLFYGRKFKIKKNSNIFDFVSKIYCK